MRLQLWLMSEAFLVPAYPHFNREELSRSLQSSGIDYHYHHFIGRKAKSQIPIQRTQPGRTLRFEPTQTIMESLEFKKGVEELLRTQLRAERTTIMCAEALWWRAIGA